MNITLGQVRTLHMPDKEGKSVRWLDIPWRTETGATGTVRILASDYTTETVLGKIKSELEAPYYQDAGKTFEVD